MDVVAVPLFRALVQSFPGAESLLKGVRSVAAPRLCSAADGLSLSNKQEG
jgi:hypothetical protein